MSSSPADPPNVLGTDSKLPYCKDLPECKGRSCRKNLKTWDSLCPASKGPARFQEMPGTPTERWEGQPYLLGDSLRLSTNSLR